MADAGEVSTLPHSEVRHETLGYGAVAGLTFIGHLLCAVPVSSFVLFHHHSSPGRMG